jgi:hypothetical protein
VSHVAVPIPITDHFAAGERMCRELLLACPDPNGPDFEGREDEMRLNSSIRAVLHEAMDMIEHCQRRRQIQIEKDDGTKDPAFEALRAGMNVGEETAARRVISRFALAFNGF